MTEITEPNGNIVKFGFNNIDGTIQTKYHGFCPGCPCYQKSIEQEGIMGDNTLLFGFITYTCKRYETCGFIADRLKRILT